MVTKFSHFKVKILALDNQNTLKKELHVKDFLKPFEKIANQKKIKLKQMIIEAIDEEINNQSIQPQFKIIQKDESVLQITKFKPQDLTKIKVICFSENVD